MAEETGHGGLYLMRHGWVVGGVDRGEDLAVLTRGGVLMVSYVSKVDR